MEPRIIVENFGAKIKDKRSNQTIVLIGNQAYHDPASKSAIKSPFDGEIVIHFDQMVSKD